MRKIVFLDRDGVINQDPGEAYYVHNWSEFEFVPGVLEALKALTEAGFELYVLSNQSGIARGKVSREELADITARMRKECARNGVKLSGVHYCEHDDSNGCACRKPGAGLYKQALGTKQAKAPASSACFNIGDSERDIEAGRAFGCVNILVLSGKAKREDVRLFRVKPERLCADMKEASEWILAQSGS